VAGMALHCDEYVCHCSCILGNWSIFWDWIPKDNCV